MPLSRLARIVAPILAVLLVGVGIAPASAADPTYSISGTVFLSGGGTAPEGMSVQATREGTSGVSAYASTLANGTYSFSGLIAGTYRVGVVPSADSVYATQYYPSGTALNDSTVVGIVVGPNAINKNVTLPVKAAISGTIYLDSTSTPSADGQSVVKWQRLSSVGGTIANGQVTVGAGGAYSLRLEPGRYILTAQATVGGYQSLKLSYDPDPSISLIVTTANRSAINGVIPKFGSLSGTVSLGSSATPAGAGAVEVKLSRPNLSGGEPTVLTDAAGHYEFTGLSDIPYILSFRHLAGMFDPKTLPTITLGTSGRDLVRDVTLSDGPTLSGVIRLDGAVAGAGAARVTAVGPVTRSALTDASGGYSIPSLVSGSYRVHVEYLGGGGFADAWWPLVSSEADAVFVSVSGAGAAADFNLPVGGSFSGVVTDPSGQPAEGISVTATYVNEALSTSGKVTAETDDEGHYAFDRVIPGEYRIEAFSEIRQFWGHTTWNPLGDLLQLAPAQNSTGIDIELFTPGGVTGTATCSYCTNPNIQYAQFAVGVQAKNPQGEWVSIPLIVPSSVFGASYSIGALEPGTYRLAGGFNNNEGPQWGIGTSSTFVIQAHNTVVRNITLQNPATERLQGVDRFETAALIAKRAFPSGADVVYISNGLNFPDALGAGPAALAENGPLLLVTPTSVPPVVLAALSTLSPDKIVITGSTASVSAAVEAQLKTITPNVVRRDGVDRFATSIATARGAFGATGATTVFVATGLNFPDALSAGPAAASLDAPVVIVNGAAGGITPQFAALLDDLGTERVFIVGSSASVSNGVQSAIQALGIEVQRFAGVDRYDTSAQVNAFAFPSPRSVYLAVGTGFPDALAGGVLAAVNGSPLLVNPPQCTPKTGVQYFLRVPNSTILLGSSAGLAAPATLFTKC